MSKNTFTALNESEADEKSSSTSNLKENVKKAHSLLPNIKMKFKKKSTREEKIEKEALRKELEAIDYTPKLIGEATVNLTDHLKSGSPIEYEEELILPSMSEIIEECDVSKIKFTLQQVSALPAGTIIERNSDISCKFTSMKEKEKLIKSISNKSCETSSNKCENHKCEKNNHEKISNVTSHLGTPGPIRNACDSIKSEDSVKFKLPVKNTNSNPEEKRFGGYTYARDSCKRKSFSKKKMGDNKVNLKK